MDIERLTLKAGEKITTAHLHQLDSAIARQTPLRGLGVRTRRLPWGTIRNYQASHPGAASAPVFRPQVTTGAQIAEIRWSGPRGLIGGLAPTKGGVEIFDDRKGNRPSIVISKAEFGDGDQCGIWFRVVTDEKFKVRLVEPFAAPSLPAVKPFIAYKLALFLRLRGGRITYSEAEDRELFCSQGFLAINRGEHGIFDPLFWAIF
ncbi:MAG: hypothetical protein ABMA13_22235 [Chthoniobacteraceae bacterium]